jgi:hypothetical protein
MSRDRALPFQCVTQQFPSEPHPLVDQGCGGLSGGEVADVLEKSFQVPLGLVLKTSGL